MLYGLLTGVFIASYSVVDGYAVKFVVMSPICLASVTASHASLAAALIAFGIMTLALG